MPESPSDSEADVANQADKPWLHNTASAATAASLANGNPLLAEDGQALDDGESLDDTNWSDESMNELINTLSLTESDIDLGEFVDFEEPEENADGISRSSMNDTLDLTNADDNSLYADGKKSDEALFKEIDKFGEDEGPELVPSGDVERFNEFDNEDNDPYDKSFNDTGDEWIDISLGDDTK